ncbi:tRNA-dependent cyclodipeptide synthase [Actinomadura sp. NPDC048955]|uniref:tRNA-dependent cyclodipeptide synthase n=1 Tax=Actinomadura sp. NPDC048955 TaxID=3158228 RepID=UPI0033F611E6
MSDVQLARVYQARARGTYWRTQAHCRLPISVGQAYHEADKLDATIDWVNRHAGQPFQRCTVVVADTLHRHNHRGADARGRAREAGDSWLARNRHLLAGLVIPYRIVRWDALLQHSSFPALHAQIQHLAEAGGDFAKALRRATDAWLARQHNPPGPDEQMFVRRYLLEEIAAIAVMEQIGPAALCYPGGIKLFETARTAAFKHLTQSMSWVTPTLADFEMTELHIRRRS